MATIATKGFSRITREHFERLARASAIAEETAAKARVSWRRLAGQVPLLPELRRELDQHIESVKL